MQQLCEATLISDVSYRDFHGRTHVVRRGSRVKISRINGAMSSDLSGNVRPEQTGAYVATHDGQHFDIDRAQFQLFC